MPEKITIDQSGANTAAIESVKANACVDILIAGIETLHMIRKGQMHRPAGSTVSAADQFDSLAT